jgi:signal transduction histidine kinase
VSPAEPSEARERLAVVGEIAAEVAHELHNLLQIISSSAFVARLAVDRGDAGGARPHVDKIERHARMAHDVVDNLMALARGDAIRTEPVLIGEAASAARADLAESASWVDEVDAAVRASAHPLLLARTLHVLYENAIHASAPRRPTITTRARTDGGRVVIEVADDGPGVPADIAQTVFDPLVSSRPGGSGLGLALARRVAAAHGGSIRLAPQAGASGATFVLELPAHG